MTKAFDPLRDFDTLPNSSAVRVQTVARLFSISVPTVWRWCKIGSLPPPIKLGQGVTAWNVGALRAAMAEREAA